MGFPTWTLWGMGLAGLGALLATVLAYIAQSPRFMRRVGLDVYRLDLRVRGFTGFALAMLLLAFGFFLAGVPLEPMDESLAAAPAPESTALSEGSTPGTFPVASSAGGAMVRPTSQPTVTFTPGATSAGPASGAFGGPLARATGTGEPLISGNLTATEVVSATVPPLLQATEVTSAASASATPTPRPDTPTPTVPPPTETPTATPTPTETPLPTLTPTPIAGAIALIDSDGSTIWIRRSPGGQQLVLVTDGDTVILMPGHANQGGAIWQEIMTVEGVIGWIDTGFLSIPETTVE